MTVKIDIVYNDHMGNRQCFSPWFKTIHFPSGEFHLRLNKINYSSDVYGSFEPVNIPVTMYAYGVCSPEDVFVVKAVQQSLVECGVSDIALVIPFMPSARQDRVAVPNDVNMLNVYYDILKPGFKHITVIDPHSLACEALTSRSISLASVIQRYLDENDGLHIAYVRDLHVVAPDAGAVKRASAVAEVLCAKSVSFADKKRNPEDGSIIGYQIDGDYTDKHCLIVDDICDGGRTFIECAKALREKGAKTVDLLVTHGLFTQGYDALLDNGIDTIYTTNSIPQAVGRHHQQVNVIDLRKVFGIC